MTSKTIPGATPPAKASAGGPAGAGGYNFQAAATAIAMAHAAVGLPLRWLQGLISDAPLAVRAETGGGGDDLRLDLADGVVVEAQVKKGLKAGVAFDAAVDGLAGAIHAGEAGYGLLLVDGATSRTISGQFARDLEAVGEGREDDIDDLASAFVGRLRAGGMEPRRICGRLRVVMLQALREDAADVRLSTALLAQVCADPLRAGDAWRLLYADAQFMVERRGLRSREAIAQVLAAGDIPLRSDSLAPVALAARLAAFVAEANRTYAIIGVDKALPVDTAAIELSLYARNDPPSGDGDLRAALERYHRGGRSSGALRDKHADIATGRFRRLAVVVGGPGMGKSTLLRRLARAYAADGHAVLKVRARDVAQRIGGSGSSVTEALFTLGLAGSGLTPDAALRAGLADWVVLVDGLDECGDGQDAVAEGLAAFAAGHPGARIVATTRPIGYRATHTASWRHYDIPALGEDEAPRRLADLLQHVLPASDPRRRDLRTFAIDVLERSRAGRAAARSPLLLSLCAALVARGQALGATRLQFYRGILRLLEEDRAERAGPPPAARAVLAHVLDTLGWLVLETPILSCDAALQRCAEIIAPALDQTPLAAAATVEDCVGWWERLGVLERVRHAGDEALTFVHLTFAEFAAGRRLAAATRETQAAVLCDESLLERFSEAVAFACAQGGAGPILQSLVETGFEGEAGQARLERALEAACEANPPLADATLNAILDPAFDCLIGALPTWASECASRLVRLAPRAPHLIRPRTEPLLGHPYRWTRASAWAVRLACDPEPDDVAPYVAGLESVLRAPDPDEALRERVASRGGDERSVREDFAVAVAAIVIKRYRPEVAGKMLRDLFSDVTGHSFGFLIDLEKVTKGTDHSVESITGLEPLRRGLWSDLDRDRMKRGMAAVDRGFLRLAELAEQIGATVSSTVPEPLEDSGRPLYVLAAFVELVGLRQMGMSELAEIAVRGQEADAVEVLSGLAHAAGLSVDALVREARIFATYLGLEVSESLTASIRRLPDLDPPPLDWGRCTGSIDWNRIEGALRSGALPIERLALEIASRNANADFLVRVAGDLLETSDDRTFATGAQLARAINGEPGTTLLLQATTRNADAGVAAAYISLGSIDVGAHPLRAPAVEAGLASGDPSVVEAAADWIQASPSNEDLGKEADLLDAAWRSWKVRDSDPDPDRQQLTPRIALLRAMDALGVLTSQRLLEALSDVRGDIGRLAVELLLPRLATQSEVRAQVVERIMDGLPPAVVARLTRPELPYEAAEVQALLGLLRSDDARLRLAAMPMLDSQHVPPSARLEALATLKHDDLGPVREAATAMIWGGPRQAS